MEAVKRENVVHRSELPEPGSNSSFEKKEKILDAAERLFGEMGFEAVSTRLLAKEAGVNMAMLAYYFGSKEKLFENMIQRRSEEGWTLLVEIVESDKDPREKMEAIIDQYVDRIFNSGRMHAIFHREISLNQRSLITGIICKSYHGKMNEIARVLTEGEEKGIFNKVDQNMTLVMLMATISQTVNSQAMTRKIFDIPENELINEREDLKLRLKNHLKSVILTYLTAKPYDKTLISQGQNKFK